MTRFHLRSTALLLALGGCAAPGADLPHVRNGEGWTVRAESEADAQAVADLLPTLVPAVRDEVATGAAFVTVLVATDSVPAGGFGECRDDGVIELEPFAPQYLEGLLAHELAHRHFKLDEALDAMPPALEEGLADVIAGRALPELAMGIEWGHAMSLPPSGSRESGRRALRTVMNEDLYADELERVRAVRAIGFVLARRLGRDGVRDLCREARSRGHEKVPADWILAACGVGAEVEEGLWSRVLREADPDGWSSFPIDGAGAAL